VLFVAFLCWRAKGSPLQLSDRTWTAICLSLRRRWPAGPSPSQRYPRLWHGETRGPGDPHIACCPHGASLATGGVGYFQDLKKQHAVAARGAAHKRTPELGDLLRIFTPGQASDLSLARPRCCSDAPVARPLRCEEHPRRRHLGCAVAAGSAHGFQSGRLPGAQAGSVAGVLKKSLLSRLLKRFTCKGERDARSTHHRWVGGVLYTYVPA